MSSVTEVTKSSNITSDEMLERVDLWLNMYSGNAPWLSKNPQSLGLPAIIASEMARMVTLEAEINISGSKMATFIDEQMKPVRKRLRTIIEYACAGGGIILKPVVNGEKIDVETVQANMFYPTAYESNGSITAGYFVYRKWIGKEVFSRLEYHELVGTTYTIKNTCYKSVTDENLGKQCSLTEVDDWAEIDPEVVIEDMHGTEFAYIKIPIGNTIDSHSPLGVSVYSRAVGLIRDADEQYQRLLWEYEGGELAIDASEDAFDTVDLEPKLPKGKERLYRTNALDIALAKDSEIFKEWAPTLRDSNYMSGLNRLLMQIEDACCLSRGTLSDAQVEARTATELRINKQRTYATIRDIQTAVEDALNELIYAMQTIALLYELCPDGNIDVQCVWDDSIIIDAEAERLRDQQEVSQGLMKKWEYRVKWYGEDEATAKAMVGEASELTDDEILGFDKGKDPLKEPEAEE